MIENPLLGRRPFPLPSKPKSKLKSATGLNDWADGLLFAGESTVSEESRPVLGRQATPSLPGAAAEKICGWNQGTRIRERAPDNTAQIVAASRRGLGFVLLEQAQSGADHLRFIIKSPTGNKPIY
jgi:hypothetical protein